MILNITKIILSIYSSPKSEGEILEYNLNNDLANLADYFSTNL